MFQQQQRSFATKLEYIEGHFHYFSIFFANIANTFMALR